jgi:hypothetical protein
MRGLIHKELRGTPNKAIELDINGIPVYVNKIVRSTTAPTSIEINDLWVDISAVPNLFKRWDGTAWVIIGSSSWDGVIPNNKLISPGAVSLVNEWDGYQFFRAKHITLFTGDNSPTVNGIEVYDSNTFNTFKVSSMGNIMGKDIRIVGYTAAQRDALVSPVAGTLIYVTDLVKFQYYNGTAWTDMGGGGAAVFPASYQSTGSTQSNIIDINHANGVNKLLNLNGSGRLQIHDSILLNADFTIARSGGIAWMNANATDLAMQRGGTERIRLTTTGVTITGNLTINSGTMSGGSLTDNSVDITKMSSGVLVGMYDIPATQITKLETNTNWTGNRYTGDPIVNTYQGQEYDSTTTGYWYKCTADNTWIRR